MVDIDSIISDIFNPSSKNKEKRLLLEGKRRNTFKLQRVSQKMEERNSGINSTATNKNKSLCIHSVICRDTMGDSNYFYRKNLLANFDSVGFTSVNINPISVNLAKVYSSKEDRQNNEGVK